MEDISHCNMVPWKSGKNETKFNQDCAHRMGRGLSCRDTIVHTSDGTGVIMPGHNCANQMGRGHGGLSCRDKILHIGWDGVMEGYHAET
jgi:hypothetical protein